MKPRSETLVIAERVRTDHAKIACVRVRSDTPKYLGGTEILS